MISTQAINLALHHHMKSNDRSVCMGLGINDPKRIFGTSNGLVESFGSSRVIEPPTSENALTGICLGLAHSGFSVCLTHQRFDFALLSFDQLINSISKWKFMFDRPDLDLSLVIRLIVGRGWGQGPTHSQSYHSFLASIPGLNVLYPYNPETFYSAIISGMSAKDPSIIIEHRWLHNVISDKSFSEFDHTLATNTSPQLLSLGDSITVFAYGYLVPEILRILPYLNSYGVYIDLLVISNLTNISLEPLVSSVLKTKNLIMIEPFTFESSITSSLATRVLSLPSVRSILSNFVVESLPFEHESTSFFQTRNRYFNANSLISHINNFFNNDIPPLPSDSYHDVPGSWFKGPF